VSIILDACLLLLLVVGTASRDYITKHRRLQAYTDADFILLTQILSRATKVIVTPNTLTETSNLAGYIAEPARAHIYELLRVLVEAAETEEQYIESKVATARTEFVRLGLTDSALLQLATESHILLTVDLDLYLAALKQGLKAENFTYHRGL
jgi:hypothetical protein